MSEFNNLNKLKNFTSIRLPQGETSTLKKGNPLELYKDS